MARRYIVMQNKRGGIAFLVILVLILVILGITNPTKADFKNFLYKQGYAEAGNAPKAFREGAGSIKAALGNLYTRQNYLIFSLFNRGDRTEYVGFAKYAFIRTKR